MARSEIEKLVVGKDYTQSLDGLVSHTNWQVISLALDGPLIDGQQITGPRPAMLYAAPRAEASSSLVADFERAPKAPKTQP